MMKITFCRRKSEKRLTFEKSKYRKIVYNNSDNLIFKEVAHLKKWYYNRKNEKPKEELTWYLKK